MTPVWNDASMNWHKQHSYKVIQETLVWNNTSDTTTKYTNIKQHKYEVTLE